MKNGTAADGKSNISLDSVRTGLPDGPHGSLQNEFCSTLQEISRSAGLTRHHRFHQMSGHNLRITSILPLPGTRRYLTSSYDCTIRLWDEETGLCLRTFTGHRTRIHSLVWFGGVSSGEEPDTSAHNALSNSVASRENLSNASFASGGEGEVLIWNIDNNVPVEVFSPGEEWTILFLEHLPQENVLVFLSDYGKTGIWHPGDKVMERVYPAGPGKGSCLSVASDGYTFYAGFDDGTLVSRDSSPVREGSERILWQGDDEHYPTAVIEAEPGGALLVGLSSGEILVLDGEREINRWKLCSTGVRSITLRSGYPDHCIVTYRLGLVQVTDWKRGRSIHQFAPPLINTRNLCWGGDSSICYCGSHSVAEVDFVQEKLVKVMEPMPPNQYDNLLLDEMVFSSDRSLMAVERIYGLIGLYDYLNGSLLSYIDLEQEWDGENHIVIGSMAFSPDNRYLAVVGLVNNGPVFIISVETGTVVTTFSGWEAQLMGVVFTLDGRELIVGGRAGTSLRKLTLDGRETGVFSGHEDTVFDLALSPDGRCLASCSGDRSVMIWDIESCRLLKRVEIEGFWPQTIVYSGNGSRLAYCNSEGEILVLETKNYSPVFRMYQPMKFPLSVALNRDGSEIAVGYLNDGIAVYTTDNGALITELQGARAQHYCGAVNGKGDRILSGHFNIVQSWPFGECLNPKVLGRNYIADTYLDISPESPILSIGGYYNSVSLLNLESMDFRPNLTQTRTTCDLNFHGRYPDQVFYLRRGADAKVYGRALKDGRFTRYIAFDSEILDALYDERDNALFFLTDDGRVWYSREDVTIWIWEAEPDMEKIVRFAKNPRSVQLLLLSEQGGLFGFDSSNVLETRLICRLDKDDADGLVFTENGKGALVYGKSGSISLIRPSDGKVVARHTAPAGIRCLCQIPGTKLLALGLKNGMIQVVSGLTKERSCFSGHREGTLGVNSLVYCQESDLLISSGHDGKICFWDSGSFVLAGTFHLFENGFLWTTPPDDLAPEGWFWTNKTDLVEVWEDEGRGRNVVAPDERERYISLYNSRERVFQAIFRRSEYKNLIRQSRCKGSMDNRLKMIDEMKQIGDGGQRETT